MAFMYILAVFIAFLITVMITKGCRWWRRRHYDVPARDVSKGHKWCMTDLFSHPTYCNISERHIIAGAYCDSCGICVEDENMKVADKKLYCKSLSDTCEMPKHHWIKGNLPLYSKCDVCDDDCGTLPSLSDLRCCWCHRTVHTQCVETMGKVCDLGAYKNFIVPPNSVRLKQVGFKGRRHLVVESVKEPNIPNWKPLIVIANRKSGNGDGEMILQAFRGLLNPAQVIDLCDIPPECGLEWCHLLPHVTFRVLAAGGDGTVGWILKAIDNLKLKEPPQEYHDEMVESAPEREYPTPQVCILPLGTGNDLSRVLGWGEGYSGDVNVKGILDEMEKAKPVSLDRWKVQVNHLKLFGMRRPRKEFVVNNYVSIGVDALVTLNFHKHRESTPILFSNRIMNKIWYFTYGTKDVLERECKDLHKKIKVELDGRRVKLPPVEGIVVLNISSWGGGCRPWMIGANSSSNIPEQKFDDGMVEVFALYSSFHIAQLQVGLAEPLRLGQAKTVKITLSGGKAPMQVDGEPWEQTPAEITVSHMNQATMLVSDGAVEDS